MLLDTVSVFVTVLLVCVVLVLYAWAMALGQRNKPWYRYWAAGNTALGAGLALYLTQGQWDPWVSVVLSNTLVLAGYLAMELGLRRFAGLPLARWGPAAILTFGAAGLAWGFFFWPSYPFRVVLMGGLTMWAVARVLVLLGRRFPGESRRRPLLFRSFLAAYGLLFLFQGLRVVLVLLEPPASLLTEGIGIELLFLVTLVGGLTWTLGFTTLDLLRGQGQLEQALEARDRMFTLVAHDLRGPIGGLVNLLALMGEAGQCREDGGQALAAATDSARDSYHLLENLLQWSQAQRGQLHLEPENLEFDRFLEETVGPLRFLAEAKGIGFRLVCPPGLTAWGDRQTLAAAVRNLVSNAVKFTPPGGLVLVEGRAEDLRILVTVRDSGPGIPPGVVDQVLLGRLPPSSPGTSGETGSGFGLNLCRDFIRANQGGLRFAPGTGGTSVTIDLPPGRKP